MNICVAALLAAALLGIADKAAGGRFSLAQQLDRGMEQMGRLCLSMTGFYCAASCCSRYVMQGEAASAAGKWIDPSLPVCMLLAVDMGGWNAAEQMAATAKLAAFNGLLVASTFGCLVSFSLPVAMGFLHKDETADFMQGVLWGVLALPFGLTAGGIVLGMDAGTLLRDLVPVILLCALLAAVLFVAPGPAGRCFAAFGGFIQALGIVLFGAMAVCVFFPGLLPGLSDLAAESMMVVFRITVIVCGANICSGLALKYCDKPLRRAAERLGVCPAAVTGLAVSAVSSISMLPLYRTMDAKGRSVNAAFCAAGAYLFGGQLAFTASVAGSRETAAFLVCKAVSGVLAVGMVCLFSPQGKAKRTGKGRP